MSYCNQGLTELPPLPNTLIDLNCSNNRLTRLPEQLPDNLKELSCSNNRLIRLPEHLPNSLTVLYCYDNRLTKFPEHLPNSLQTLWCWNNCLIRLPHQLPNSLTWINCSNNPFLFILRNNLYTFLKWNYQNPMLFTNYKILVSLLYKKKNCLKSLILLGKFMNRDISRECSRY